LSRYIGCVGNYNDAKCVLFGSPFDGTSSFRPGSRFAPEAIRRESWGLETYSPYQNKDVAIAKVYDSGDLELPFGNAEAALDMVKKTAAKILSDGKTPVMLGGEHLMTLGLFRAVYEKYNDVCVIHFDAHTDLRDEYLGEKLSHATVVRRVYEIIYSPCHSELQAKNPDPSLALRVTKEGAPSVTEECAFRVTEECAFRVTRDDKRVWQFGIRSGEKCEFEFAEKHGHITKFTTDGIDTAVASLKGRPVFVTVDLDVLDPSVFPGTGTPEPGGVQYMDLQNALIQLGQLNVVGFDIVELAPDYDRSGISTAAACKILREMLIAFAL